MTWIKTIPYNEAAGQLKELYDRIKGPNGKIDNIMTAHSLRPHTLVAHMNIYKNVLHHHGNRFPKEFLEAIGTYVSILNKCKYCVEHHYAGMARLLGDPDRALEIRAALEIDQPKKVFDDKHTAILKYVKWLTLTPDEITERAIEKLRVQGVTDGEILEINQVTAYFCYANRTVLGLGIELDGDILGLSPNNTDPDDWTHT